MNNRAFFKIQVQNPWCSVFYVSQQAWHYLDFFYQNAKNIPIFR